jgi:hypothetical protein
MDTIHALWQSLTQDWLLLIWIPVSVLIVHKGQRLKIGAFIIVISILLRLQVELVQSTGFAKGFTGLIDMSLEKRGLIVHSIFIALFLLLSYLSPNTKGAIYLAASLSLFFMSFFLSSIFMLM